MKTNEQRKRKERGFFLKDIYVCVYVFVYFTSFTNKINKKQLKRKRKNTVVQ